AGVRDWLATDAWDRIKADSEIGVAVLTGSGPAFSAGAGLAKLVPHIRGGTGNQEIRGLTSDDGGELPPPRIVGLGRATELILSGRFDDADEALRIGFVTKIV